jgi:hypothetical protein
MNIEELIKDPTKLKDVFEEAIKTKNKELTTALISYIDDPELIYKYAKNIVKGKLNEREEDIIATSAYYSYRYARDILKGPFPKGENIIANSPFHAYVYAEVVLKDRFKKGEEAIINGPYITEYLSFLKRIGKFDEFLKDHPEVLEKLKHQFVDVEKYLKSL